MLFTIYSFTIYHFIFPVHARSFRGGQGEAVLQILDGIGADSRLEESQRGTLLADDLIEYVHRVLLALIVAEYAYLYLSIYLSSR